MTWLAVVASGLAALIGALLSPFAKEALQDRFQKFRRKKEARTQSIKILVKIFRRMGKHTSLQTTTAIYKHRIEILKNEKVKAVQKEDQALADTISGDIHGIFEHGNSLLKEQNEGFDYLIDQEAELISIAVEAMEFLKPHQYKQLRKVVEELFIELGKDYNITGFETIDDHSKLIEWHAKIFPIKFSEIDKKLSERRKHYEIVFKEIFES